MRELKIFRDEQGRTRAQGSDERLATFLETDLQSSVAICEELLRLVDDAHSTSEFTGNAHHLTISAKTVTIESTIDPHARDRRLRRAEFRHAVSAWLAMIRQPQR